MWSGHHIEVLLRNYNRAIRPKMRFGCNFWLEGPIDLGPTRLNCILRDTPLAIVSSCLPVFLFILSSCQCVVEDANKSTTCEHVNIMWRFWNSSFKCKKESKKWKKNVNLHSRIQSSCLTLFTSSCLLDILTPHLHMLNYSVIFCLFMLIVLWCCVFFNPSSLSLHQKISNRLFHVRAASPSDWDFVIFIASEGMSCYCSSCLFAKWWFFCNSSNLWTTPNMEMVVKKMTPFLSGIWFLDSKPSLRIVV